MLEHSFKRLKKEQNKLIEKTFYNLQNPVRFNIAHMFKLYKQGIIKKNEGKLNLLKDGNNLNDTNPLDDFI